MRSFGERLGLGLVCVSMVACATTYRGAVEVDPSEVPRGRLIATFARTECTGQPASAPVPFVDYVQGADGSPFMVERSGKQAWLLITNSRVVGDTVIFQAVRSDGAAELREYRFPARGTEPGQYFHAERYAPPRGSKHRFETQPVGEPTSCRLVPVDPLTGAALATYGRQAPAASATAVRGWGFDGSSFEVGDRVLVDVGGSSAPAVVLQAPGDAYYVRLESEPEGTGRWIDPSRITGRLE